MKNDSATPSGGPPSSPRASGLLGSKITPISFEFNRAIETITSFRYAYYHWERYRDTNPSQATGLSEGIWLTPERPRCAEGEVTV